MDNRNHSSNSRCRPGVPPKLGEQPDPLPFLKPPAKPSTRVHTAETTINGKTYITTTVETPYGSTTTTKEKTPETVKQQERIQKMVDIVFVVIVVCTCILFVLALQCKRG